MSDQNHDAGLDNPFVLENETDRTRTPVEGETRVGRDPASDLVLASGKASRLHAKLTVEDGKLWVEDQKSTNGTYVNREKISTRTSLDDQDVVQFGDIRFRVIGPPKASGAPADQGTVMIGQETMLHAFGEEEKESESGREEPAGDEARGKPAPAAKGKEPAAKPEPAKKPAKKKAKKAETSKGDAAAEKAVKTPARGSQGASKKEPEAPESPSVESHAVGNDPSIPRSWADADRLEQAGGTAFVVRGSGSGESGKQGLNPAKAVKEARQTIPAQEPILVGLTPPIEGKPFKLSRKGGTEKWEMGRGEGADIAIDDDSVSGRHAQLICENGRWKVVNMMSVNGTFVNERKVLSAYLSPHDVIRMGSVELVFDARVSRRTAGPAPEASVAAESSSGGSGMAAVMNGLQRLWQSILGLFGKK